MKLMRYLFVVALVCGLARVAKADDFKMVVIDPYSGPYLTYPIYIDTDTFTFATCSVPGQDPTGTYDECFTGQNETGQVLTSLLVELPLIVSQTAGCSLAGGGLDLFTTATCSTNADGYLLNFFGGPGIAEGETFTVAEAGVTADFPDATAVFNTPEPGSFWLLSTGVLAGGLVFGDWRRRQLNPVRS